MTKYPIGIQNFQRLRKDGYLYVDRTAFVNEMANSGKYYFLSRPRRFEKSLLPSTIKAYFQGEKGLFKGLALEQFEKDWEVYPIFHIDLNTGNIPSQRLWFPPSNATITLGKKNGGPTKKTYQSQIISETLSNAHTNKPLRGGQNYGQLH